MFGQGLTVQVQPVPGSFPSGQTWAQTLVLGNVSGGRNPTLSNGDVITDDGAGGGVSLVSTGGAGIGLTTSGTSSAIQGSTNLFSINDKTAANTFVFCRAIVGQEFYRIGNTSVGNGSILQINDVTKLVTIKNNTSDLFVGINKTTPTAALDLIGNVWIDKAGHNANVGINTAPDSSVTLKILGNVQITDGTQAAGYVLTSDVNGLATWQAPATPSGFLLATGATEGATVSSQRLNKGVTIGKASTDNGVIIFKNAAGVTDLTLSSTAAKALLIDNTGHDVILGINGAGETGYGLKVTGKMKSTVNVNTPSITNVLGDVALDMSVADTLSITASAGVSVSSTIATASAQKWDLGHAGATVPQAQDTRILVTIEGVEYNIHATAA